MSQMTGADADALDAAAEQLTLAADELDASASSLASTLGAVRWLGAVSIRFSDLWSSQHNPRMSKTSGFLRDAARDLRGQASDQRRAAESNGSPRAAPVAAAIAPGVTAPKPGRLETDAARQAILKRADTMLKNDRYLTQFPGAMAEVRRWRDEALQGLAPRRAALPPPPHRCRPRPERGQLAVGRWHRSRRRAVLSVSYTHLTLPTNREG